MSTEEIQNQESLVNNLKAVVADAEELLSATANQTGEKIQAARAKITAQIETAKTRLVEAEEVLRVKTKAAARATDEYVHENPWQSVIIAAGVGFIIGFLSRR